MPALKKTSQPLHFVQLASEAHGLCEKNDCAVKAVAIVCGVSYAAAHAALAARGRKSGHGTYTYHYLEVIKSFGKALNRVDAKDIIAKYPSPHNAKIKHVTSHHPRRFAKVWDKNKTYLMMTAGHVFAVINGETVDWSVNKSLLVRTIHEVV